LKRRELKERLDRITDMTDEEIAINANWIKEAAAWSLVHLHSLHKDNQSIKRKAKKAY